MLRLYRRQMRELMGDQPPHASHMQYMVDHINFQASFWNNIIIWCWAVGQVKSLVSSEKTILNNIRSILQPAIIIMCEIVSFSFWILPCLATPLKRELFVAGDSMACDGLCDRATVPGHCLPGWTTGPGPHVGSHSLAWSEAQKTQQAQSTNWKWLLCSMSFDVSDYITWHLVGIKWVH